jgi:hypothetical protein
MNSSDEKTNNDPVFEIASGTTDAKEALGLTVNQDLQKPVEPMEIERHGARVAAPSLYRRGRQAER